MTQYDTKFRRWNSFAVIALVLFIGLCFAVPAQVKAAGNPSSISECELSSSGKYLYVKAKVNEKTSAMGKKFYLIGLSAYKDGSGSTTIKPVASVKAKKGTIKFKVKYEKLFLYKKFVVAYKSKSKYKIISTPKYIDNPEVLATYTGKGPKTFSKKGLQVEDTADSLELGVQHAVINWTLSSLVNEAGTPYRYKGKTYYFDESLLQYYDNLVKTYNDSGAKVTVILLLPNDGDPALQPLRYEGKAASKFSSIKTSKKAGCYEFEAIMTYLAKRYGNKDHLVSGWILGNEVNSPYVWNYGGGKSLNSYMDNYVRSFRICYNAVKSVNKKAKVYISLDNNWNKDADGDGKMYFTTKSVLDTFYKKIKAESKITFNIAYHAYPQGMGDPVFWDDSMATNSTSSKIINFKNLSVLTNYVKKNFGKNYTIMLSEQSFNSTRGENVQAAAYAYAYYISEADSMIESFIYGREFDHPTEGYNWGLCDGWRGKRLIWNVFQYIDSKDSSKFTNPLRKYTNISSWKKIKGFKDSKYKSMPSNRKKAVITNIETASGSSVKLTWDKISSADGYEIYRWSQNDPVFRLIKTISMNSTIEYQDSGLTSGETYVYKIRMYKGAPDAKNANARVKLYGDYSADQSIRVSTGQVKIRQDKTSVDGNVITVGWNNLAESNGYVILRSETKDGAYGEIGRTTESFYKDTNTIGGVTYYYKVIGYVNVPDGILYGRESDYVYETASIKLDVQPINGKMTFNWTRWLNAPRYRVYCSVGNDNNYLYMESGTGLSFSGNSFSKNNIDFTFVKGQTYYFKVRAYFGEGNYGSFSEAVRITVGDELDMTGTRDGEEPETPSTETPSTEAPSTETPSTEMPSTETPSTETPSTETPSTETPSTETPSTETPSTETPSTEMPSTETPSTEAPSAEMPSTQTPPAGADIPSTETPPAETEVL